MTRDVPRRRFLAGTAVAALTTVAGCTGSTPFVGKRTESTTTVPVRAATTLSVRNSTGDLTLRGSDRQDVRVHTIKQASSVGTDVTDLSLETSRENGDLRLSARWSGSTGFFASRPSMDIDAELPASLAVGDVATAVGDVTVTDVAGDLTAEADTGDVRAERVGGTVDIESGTGDVAVRAPDVLGSATTDTGDVSVDVPAIEGKTAISTDTGDVVAYVAPDLDARIVATSSNGDVDLTDISLSNRQTASEPARESVSGTLGDGGPTLRIESTTGDVIVRPL
jgi:DUF4097 and DUF4098 domain-containing protein YvlB